MKASFHARTISLILASLGLVISGYLTWRHVVLTGHLSGGGADVCSALFGIGCDAALSSAASFQFGLPLAGWGLIYYVTLVAFLLLARFLGEALEFEHNFAALLLSLPALCISVPLSAMMLTGNAPFCPLCGLAHLINLMLVFSLKRATGRPVVQLFQAFFDGGKYLLTGKTANPVLARWKLLGLLTVALVAVVVYQWILIEATPHEALTNRVLDPQQVLEVFEASVEQDIPVGADDPIVGPVNALA